MDRRLELIHIDPSFLVVNKPSGLLSLPDRFESNSPHLKGELEGQFGPLWTVHRLDRFTSGLVLLARSEEVHRKLNMAFQERSVLKKYQAVVHGRVLSSEGSIDAPIRESTSHRGRYEVHPKGKPALSSWELLDAWAHFSHLELELHTGRTHQLRVHLLHVGHPIVADPLYSPADALYLSEIKRKRFQLNKHEEERPLIARQALHASRLDFSHPVTGGKCSFTAPLPKDMSALIRQISKWDL